MADPDGPSRLWQRRDLSPELSRALYALRTAPDDGPRLLRVAGGLGALLDRAHEPTSRIIRRSELQGRGVSLRQWLAGGLAVLAPIVWLARTGWPVAGEPAPLTTASAGRPLPAASAPLVSPAPERAEVLTLMAAEPPSDVQHAARPAPTRSRAKHGSRSSPPSAAATDERSAVVELPLAAEPATPVQPPTAAEVAEARSAAVAEPPQPVSAPAEVPAPRVAPAAASGGVSESDLLLAARAAVRANPERALSLVAEHEVRFPRGALVPEREVLAIEVLRSLGRQADAKARLSRFAARYPGSFYLEGLQR